MKKFAIVLCTYYRKNGSTFSKISRAIDSIKKQTYDDWKVFLIGDHYELTEEFEKICSLLPEDKITSINLPNAAERENPQFSGHALWCSAGANASNHGINLSLEEGYEIHCHLDDDDVWKENHLQTLSDAYSNFPESVFIYTNCLYTDRNGFTTIFPSEQINTLEYDNLPPRPERLIHSSVSWKLDKIPFRHRNVFEQGRIFPGDADMWERINHFCIKNNYKTLYIPLTTVIKFDEAEMLK
jgi:glycosyltransferase involved in cell wall biosynthesis